MASVQSSISRYGEPTPSMTSKRETMDLTGSVYLITSDGETIKLPIPTKSRRDPLNWGMWKRVWAFAALLLSAISSFGVVQVVSLVLQPLVLEYPYEETKPFDITILQSTPTLFMGLGAFIWIPLSLAVGRRPVLLLCSLIVLITTILAGFLKDFYPLMTALCLQGLAAGAWTSLAILVVIDLTFIHQRPIAIAMIWSLVGAADMCMLSALPFMADAMANWRVFYMIWTGPAALACLAVFFLFPETYFVRPAVAFDGRIIVQSATEKIKLYDSWEEVPGGKDLPETPGWSRYDLKVWGTTKGGWKAMRACYPQILLCILNPLVFWVAVLEALVFGSMLSIGETYATVLLAPPYSLPIHIVALVNMAGAIGSLAAWPAAGLLVVTITRRLSMKNRGVRDAEYYLPAFILPVLAAAASVVVYGLAVQRKWHPVWIYFSYTLNSFGFAGLAAANSLWVTEAFPRWAAPAMVIVSGLSYVASFGINFTIVPWVKSQGYAGQNLQLGGAILAVGLVAVPISFWGKRLRQYIDGKWAVNEMGALRPQ
ncbi:hypothetical protein ONS96_008473 [Cadophora gregata f. sp. sojae]|nr:hypothetical protein ONS96_008473 [Cadophora gregata f. sp. sojae]